MRFIMFGVLICLAAGCSPSDAGPDSCPVQCPTGPTGPQGVTGPTGPIGLTGAPGTNGAPGAVGVQGAQGPTGATGPQGAQGPTGAQGPGGAALTKGSIYTRTASINLSAYAFGAAVAYCNDVNDVLLHGGCDSTPSGGAALYQAMAAYETDTATRAEWSCGAWTANSTATITAYATCIMVP